MLKASVNPDYKNPMYPDNDQEQTISQLSDMEIAWLAGLPYYIELPEFNTLVVHAGLVPGKTVAEQSKEILTMVRYVDPDSLKMMPLVVPGFRQPPGSVFWAELWDGKQNVIFGHTVVGREWIQGWKARSGAVCFGIDTGCVFGGRLTAMIFDGEDRTILQIPSAREYSRYGGE